MIWNACQRFSTDMSLLEPAPSAEDRRELLQALKIGDLRGGRCFSELPLWPLKPWPFSWTSSSETKLWVMANDRKRKQTSKTRGMS